MISIFFPQYFPGLKSESIRWKESVTTLNGDLLNLSGDVFLSAACVSYYGAFTGEYRQELQAKWFDFVNLKPIIEIM
jgi:hypothetical protein